MSKRKADEMDPPGGPAAAAATAAASPQRPASQRLRGVTAVGEGAEEETPRQLSAAPAAAAAASGDSNEKAAQPVAAASSSGVASAAVRSLHRLAAVELQLVMQCCDLQTLLSLARCSRFTLAAASHDFAWRSLSPLSFEFSTTTSALGVRLRASRLLSHCDVSLRWADPPLNYGLVDVRSAELAALESVPRLVALDTRSKYLHSRTFMWQLLAHPALGRLTALHTASQMDSTSTALLRVHQPRLRTLTLRPFATESLEDEPERHRDILAPLPRLRSLTDLSLDGFILDAECAASITACASLRRLDISDLPLEGLPAVLTAPTCAQLESLSLTHVHCPEFVGHVDQTVVDMWTAIFTSQRALHSLRLVSCMDNAAALGAAAAMRNGNGNVLRNLTALRADTLRMDNDDGSLLPLLAAHCPQLRQLHLYHPRDNQTELGSLDALPLLRQLSDLRLGPIHGDYQVIGECAALRQLHLTDMDPESLHALLCSPQLERLETLTLESAYAGSDEAEDDEVDHEEYVDHEVAGHRQEKEEAEDDEDADGDEDGEDDDELRDWSRCFANLHSLRTLSLGQSGRFDTLLRAIQAVRPPALRRIRFCPHKQSTDAYVNWKVLVDVLRLLPSLTVELLVYPAHSKLAPADFDSLCAQWQSMGPHAVVTRLSWETTRDPFDCWRH